MLVDPNYHHKLSLCHRETYVNEHIIRLRVLDIVCQAISGVAKALMNLFFLGNEPVSSLHYAGNRQK